MRSPGPHVQEPPPKREGGKERACPRDLKNDDKGCLQGPACDVILKTKGTCTRRMHLTGL
jgi:hypothetical protein